MTKTCYYGNHPAEAIKVEIETEQRPDPAGDYEVETERRLPICLVCAERWYDGTEERPGLLPLP